MRGAAPPGGKRGYGPFPGEDGAAAAMRQPLVAVAVDRDKPSQSALKWALDNLVPRGQTIMLVHVASRPASPDASSSPSPSLSGRLSLSLSLFSLTHAPFHWSSSPFCRGLRRSPCEGRLPPLPLLLREERRERRHTSAIISRSTLTFARDVDAAAALLSSSGMRPAVVELTTDLVASGRRCGARTCCWMTTTWRRPSPSSSRGLRWRSWSSASLPGIPSSGAPLSFLSPSPVGLHGDLRRASAEAVCLFRQKVQPDGAKHSHRHLQRSPGLLHRLRRRQREGGLAAAGRPPSPDHVPSPPAGQSPRHEGTFPVSSTALRSMILAFFISDRR